MAIDIQIEQYDDYVHFIITGTFETVDSANKFSTVLALSEATGISKILIDFRAVQNKPTTIEKMLYVFQVQKRYKKYLSDNGIPLQMAYLGSKSLVKESVSALEAAIQNGLPFNLFSNETEAYEWLGVQPGA